ncbi:hypothetical protein OTU49_010557 [Cherax quadricarinatus]|uniref:Uncharacterized protein n=1 Tax=Cherax quadricarinatus TaxID=27406 RepID=A0AAW0WFC9_CHEQU
MNTFVPLALTLLAVAANAAPAAQIGPLFGGTTTTTTESPVTTSERTLSVGSHPVPLNHGIKARSAQSPLDDDNSSTEKDDKTEPPVTIPAFRANRPFAPHSLTNDAPNSRPVRETDDTTTTTTTTFPTTSDSTFSAHLSPVGLSNSGSRPVRQLTSSTTEINTTTESDDVPRFHARVPIKTTQD